MKTVNVAAFANDFTIIFRSEESAERFETAAIRLVSKSLTADTATDAVCVLAFLYGGKVRSNLSASEAVVTGFADTLPFDASELTLTQRC